MRALLTGFEPFKQWTVNSSGEAVKALGGMPGIATRVLPVDHAAAAAALREAIAEVQPSVVLCTGLASEQRPRLELRARRPEGVADGHAVLTGLWPWAAGLAAIRSTGAPVRLSEDAGAYVCETVYWTALDARLRLDTPPLVGFLHVPPVSDDWPVARHATVIAACLSAAE